jgi:uncharacterized membrane protein
MTVEVLRGVTLFAATLATGLLAGIIYTYGISIMPGLALADDRTMVTAMQHFNSAIVNPWFAACFFGAPLLMVVAGLLNAVGGRWLVVGGIVAALVLYVAVVAVTARFNIPLNNALAAAGPADQIADLQAVREQFEAPWVRWNTVRAAAAAASFGCLVGASVLYGRALS